MRERERKRELICADSIISYDDLRHYFSTESEIYVLKKILTLHDVSFTMFFLLRFLAR